jgi:hypothetical protein
VLCSSGPNSITTAKSSAGLQRRSRSSPWRRLFWRQLPLTFCANHLELSATILMSALPPKADICSAQAHVRFVPIVDICKMDRGCGPTSGAALQLPRRRSLGSGRANPTATKRSSPPPMRALTTVSTRMSPSRRPIASCRQNNEAMIAPVKAHAIVVPIASTRLGPSMYWMY